MDISAQSIAQLNWPKERVSTNLCPKCGDYFHLDLHELQFDEILHSARSGLFPDGVECVVYSKLMGDAQKDLDRCQSELRRLEGLAIALKEQQELLLTYMAVVHSQITSPIRKLPEDILLEVFKYVCCEDIGTNCILLGNKTRLPTLTLSRVCIQWYNLVTSTPMLWSSFGTQDLSSSHNASLFKVFLERSHLHFIDFGVEDSRSWRRRSLNTSGIPFDSLRCVAESANRWRHVNISTCESVIRAMLQPSFACGKSLPRLLSLIIKSETPDAIAFPIKCPNLKSLTLDAVALEFEAPLPAVTHLELHSLNLRKASQIIAWCPNVQEITLRSNFPISIALPTRLEVPLPTVTHLDLEGMTVEEAFRLIARCPNLQDLTLNFLHEFETSPVIKCIARRLAIKFGEYPSIVGSLRNMAFPELVHLVLSACDESYYSWDIESLWPMLERNNQHLTHLSLCTIHFPAHHLLRLFLCVPTVTVLDLEEHIIGAYGSDVHMVFETLIAPCQENELEEPGKDGDNDEVTLDSEDRFHEYGDELESDDDEKKLPPWNRVNVPEGLCLLPRLKELNLVTRSRNKLLLQLVRSRWKPSSLIVPSGNNIGSGACVCLQTLRLKYPGDPTPGALKRLKALEKSLDRFKKAGMVVEVSRAIVYK